MRAAPHARGRAMSDAVAHFGRELAGIRSGRAAPGLLEHLTVDSSQHGPHVALRALGTVVARGPQLLAVELYDRADAKAVAAAIERSALRLQVGRLAGRGEGWLPRGAAGCGAGPPRQHGRAVPLRRRVWSRARCWCRCRGAGGKWGVTRGEGARRTGSCACLPPQCQVPPQCQAPLFFSSMSYASFLRSPRQAHGGGPGQLRSTGGSGGGGRAARHPANAAQSPRGGAVRRGTRGWAAATAVLVVRSSCASVWHPVTVRPAPLHALALPLSASAADGPEAELRRLEGQVRWRRPWGAGCVPC
jgi:hypothetical protein